MLNDPSKEAENEPIEVRCYFVRERNALLVRGIFPRSTRTITSTSCSTG